MIRDGEARRPSPDGRLVRHEDRTWHIREIDATHLPGAPRSSSLVFECDEAVRRVWVFPTNWQQMNDASLWRLAEVSPVRAPGDVDWRAELQSAFMTSVIAKQSARVAVEQSRLARAESRRLREQRQRLLDACRTSRDVLQATVRRLTREMIDAGLSQAAVLRQLTARMETVAFVLGDEPSIARLEHDVARWCTQEFEAA